MFYFKFEALLGNLNSLSSIQKGILFQDLILSFFNSKSHSVKEAFLSKIKSLEFQASFSYYFSYIKNNPRIDDKYKNLNSWILRIEANKFSELSDLRFAPPNSENINKQEKIGFLFDIKLSENGAKEHLMEIDRTKTKYFNYLLWVIYPSNYDNRIKMKIYGFDEEIDIESIFESVNLENIKIIKNKEWPFFKWNSQEDYPYENNFYYKFENYKCFWNTNEKTWLSLFNKLSEFKSFYLIKINSSNKYCNLL